MAKTLKKVLEQYKPKAADEQKFVDKHVIVKHDDANGNKDDVFQGTNVKKIDRKKERHGYDTGADEKVYEEKDQVSESLPANADAGDYVKDFKKSNAPQFKGKSKEKRRVMAIAAYLNKEEVEHVEEGAMDKIKSAAKKALEKMGGGTDSDQLKNLQKKMGVPQTGKKPTNEEVEQAEAESLIENFEMISEVSLGAKIKAYASHSSDAFEHDDMGNDEESEHHNARAEKIHAHILKHHGVEAANHAEKAAASAIFGNGKHKSIDSLSGGLRGQHSKSVTKSGKIPKNTQSAMKNSVKGSYGKRIVGPKGHLPEETEHLQEGEMAHAQFQKYHADTAKLLKNIHQGLSKHYDIVASKKGFNNGQAHWGHVGDIKDIHRTLQDIHDRVLQNGEYAKPVTMTKEDVDVTLLSLYANLDEENRTSMLQVLDEGRREELVEFALSLRDD